MAGALSASVAATMQRFLRLRIAGTTPLGFLAGAPCGLPPQGRPTTGLATVGQGDLAEAKGCCYDPRSGGALVPARSRQWGIV